MFKSAPSPFNMLYESNTITTFIHNQIIPTQNTYAIFIYISITHFIIAKNSVTYKLGTLPYDCRPTKILRYAVSKKKFTSFLVISIFISKAIPFAYCQDLLFCIFIFKFSTQSDLAKYENNKQEKLLKQSVVLLTA